MSAIYERRPHYPENDPDGLRERMLEANRLEAVRRAEKLNMTVDEFYETKEGAKYK